MSQKSAVIHSSKVVGKLPVLQHFAERIAVRPFTAPPLLRNRHAMTIFGSKRSRTFALSQAQAERREFKTEPDTTIVAFCHWQPERQRCATIIVVHGLQGTAEAHYVMGVADKAWRAGFNVIRVNVRNCGGTMHMTPTLYHSGLTADWHAITRELIERDGLPALFFVGFSMGGNQSLKFAGELGEQAPPQLRGVVAISPPVSLEACSRAIMRAENFIYEWRFILSLRRAMKEKVRLFPDKFAMTPFLRIRHLWDWDEAYQHHNGFDGAQNFYDNASSLPFIPQIRVPTAIITAQDDPFIPFESFGDQRIVNNPNVLLVPTSHGGHVAFCGESQPDEDRGWAEARAVEFCQTVMSE